MFDPFACASSLKENLLSYMGSSLPIGNHPSQIGLGDEFYEKWSQELFKGPFVEALPKYELGPSLSTKYQQLSAKIAQESFWSLISRSATLSWQDIDQKWVSFLKPRDRLRSKYLQEQEAESAQTSIQRLWNQRLYRHQWEALRLICNDHRSIVVTTGTGSGKTECYLLPLLQLLVSEPSSVRATLGVRAVILFPMNALVEDQLRRLRKLLFWINLASATEPNTSPAHLRRPITFGRYTGDTPVNESDSSRSQPSDHIGELGELVTRSQMRAAPPDILVTNFSMLEYALLRSDDQVLFQNARMFKMLVLDEVHTYSGTVGAEVAMLLRRLRAFLCERAGPSLPLPICVGTSATVGSGQQAASEMAKFASSLFGCPFQSDQILLGKLDRVATSSGSLSPDQRRELADGLSKFVRKRPLLFRLISGNLRINDELDWEVQLGSDIEEFAILVDGCWKNMETEIRNLDLLSADPESRARALLGLIVRNSLAVHLLVDLLQASDRNCSDLAELSAEFFPSYNADEEHRTAAQSALSLLLIVVANATVDGRAFFPIRFHHFVSEKREGFACVNGACRDPGINHSKTDGWWSRLFLQHHRNCPVCQSIAYPIFVCRKCGFVYLQAWRRPDAICLPEKDDLESRSCRFLFRPVAELPYTAEDLDARKRALCLSCGHWFESADTAYGKEAQSTHASRCQAPRIIDIFEWSEDQSDYLMSECAVCEQNWYAGREVVTAPTISPFAAATMFIEELVSNSSTRAYSSKLISFSDTRQQAAKLASKLQRTNRDFVFRQLLFQLIATTGKSLTAVDLFQELYKEIRNDDRTRQLLIDSPQSVHDDLALEQILADLTFRELTSAYHTLESLGLVRVDYGPKLLSAVADLVIPGSWKDSLNTHTNQDLVRLILDWGFRFRHCVDSAANKLPVRMEVLQQWKIFKKRVPGPKFGKKSQMEAVLFLDRLEVRNPLFNFMSRLWDRGKNRGRQGPLDKNDFNALMFSVWQVFFGDIQLLTIGRTSAEANRDFVAFRPTEPEFGALQLNINSLRLTATNPNDIAFQCDVCGRLNHYTVGGVCPVRKCQGILKAISQSEVEKRFAPTRHYRRLIRERELRPLRVEEHTAEIANAKRLDIERRFRGDDDESVDVISGSTTFELGVDLGSIGTVFLANLPPRLSNYRQRAGRAGRREGMVPFVLSYVRERPHDQYFWRDLKSFISGPVPTPKFKLASEEVLKRHGFSVVLSFALSEYQKAGGASGKLWGPLWKNMGPFLFDQKNRAILQKRAETGGDIANSLRVLYDGIEEPLLSKLKATAVSDAFYERLRRMEPVMAARGDEGCIKVLGDYGILPTYAFPIYVDELRLNSLSPDRPPRCDLQLTRDRRISLVEYYPGRRITAGKVQIQSNGIWDGFDVKAFKRCARCAQLFFNANAPSGCSYCGQVCENLTAVIPWGGYYGAVVDEGNPPEVDYDEMFSSEVVFDPANDPRPEFRSVGSYISVATIDANVMRTARMRQFSPRPGSKNPLQLERRNDVRDVAAPHTPVVCLALNSGQSGSPSQPYYLLHEFSTDIIRLRLAAGSQAQVIQSSPKLTQVLAENSLNNQKRQWLKQNFWLTLGESLLIASARYLDIDETGSAELGITFKDEPGDTCLDNREVILFDTAPGGAGYVREIAAHLKDVCTIAAGILSQCACGDSCYRCLRSYRNQWIHSRLDRHLVSEGLNAFLSLNWS